MSFNQKKIQGSRESFNKVGKIVIIVPISGKALPGVMGKDKISACAIEMVRVLSPGVDVQFMMGMLEDTDRESLFFQLRQYLSDQSCLSGA